MSAQPMHNRERRAAVQRLFERGLWICPDGALFDAAGRWQGHATDDVVSVEYDACADVLSIYYRGLYGALARELATVNSIREEGGRDA